MTKAQPTGSRGGNKPTEDGRRRLSEKGKAQWAALTPAEREARLARIGRKPRGSTSSSKPPADDPPDPPAERRSPLAMTPLEFIRSMRGRG